MVLPSRVKTNASCGQIRQEIYARVPGAVSVHFAVSVYERLGRLPSGYLRGMGIRNTACLLRIVGESPRETFLRVPIGIADWVVESDSESHVQVASALINEHSHPRFERDERYKVAAW